MLYVLLILTIWRTPNTQSTLLKFTNLYLYAVFMDGKFNIVIYFVYLTAIT